MALEPVDSSSSMSIEDPRKEAHDLVRSGLDSLIDEWNAKFGEIL